MKKAKKPSRPLVVRIARGIGWVLVGLLTIVVLFVGYWRWGGGRTKVLELVSNAASASIEGSIKIRDLGSVSLQGTSGVDIELFDPAGTVVAAAEDVSVAIAVLPLVKQVLFGKGALHVVVDSLRVRHLRVFLSEDESGELGFMKAVKAKEEPPGTPPAPPTLLNLNGITIDNAWIHGALQGIALDVDLRRWSLDVAVEEVDLAVTLKEAHFAARSLPEIQRARGDLEAALVYSDPGGVEILDALKTVKVDLKVDAQDRRLDLHLNKQARDVSARLDVQGIASADLRALGVEFNSTAPTSLHAEAKGTTAALDFATRVATGDSAVDIKGRAILEPELAVEATIDIDSFALGVVAPGMGSSRLDAHFDVNARQQATLWLGSVKGSTEPLTIVGQRLPGLNLQAELSPEEFAAHVTSRTRANATRITVRGPHPQKIAPGARYTFDARTTIEEVKSLAGPLPVQARGNIQAEGWIDPEQQTLDASVHAQVWDIDDGAGDKVAHMTLAATARGSLSDPALNVKVWAEKAELQGRNFEEVRVQSEGRLSRSQATLTLRSPQGDITARTAWGATDGLLSSGLDVDFEKGQTKIRIRADRIAVAGPRVTFDNLRIDGAGSLQTSGYFSPTGLRLIGSARDLDLQKLSDAAQVQGYKWGGKLDFDADFWLDVGNSKGRMTVRINEIKLPAVRTADPPLPPEKIAGTLDLIGQGGDLWVGLNAETEGHENVDGTSSRIIALESQTTLSLRHLKTLFDAAGWQDAPKDVKANVDINLDHASPFLPQDLPYSAKGDAHIQLQMTRAGPGADPDVSVEMKTLGLGLQALHNDIPARNSPVRGVQDVDVRMRFNHDASKNVSDLRGALLYKTKPLVRVNLELKGGLNELAQGDMVANLRRAPLQLKVRVPRRQIRAFPAILGMPQLKGAVMAKLDVEGSGDNPRVKLLAQAFRLGADVKDAPVIDGKVLLQYDGKRLDLRGNANRGTKESLKLMVLADYDAAALSAGRPPSDVRAELVVDDFPADIFPQLVRENIHGNLAGKVKVERLGSVAPEIHAEVDLSKLRVNSIPFREAVIRLDIDGREAKANLHLLGKDWFAEGDAVSDLSFAKPWAPEVGERQAGKLETEGFRLGLLKPLVPDDVAGLDGRLDIALAASRESGETVVGGTARVREGSLQVPALGQQIKDIQADLNWEKNGRVRLDNTSFRGITGRGVLEATAQMDGLSPRYVDASFTIDRTERLPLSLQGFGLGEVYGRITTRADFKAKEKRIEVVTKIPEFSLRMPEVPSADVQDLEADPGVAAGVFMDQRGFATLPLQPMVEPEPPAEDPWTLDARIELGSDVWVQQGPARRVQIGGAIRIVSAQEMRMTGQLTLARGRIDINGRLFDVNEGTITLQPEEPSNPIIMVEASWTSPEGVIVFASFLGPVSNGKLTLRSEPPLSQGEILSLVLFGTTDGLNGAGSKGGGNSNGTSQALSVGGGVATQGLNQALSRLSEVDVSTRIDSDESGNARPEVVVQLTSSLSAQIGYNVAPPAPGKSPDRTLLVLELRLVGGHSLATTLGDRGTTILDWNWRYRY